jgi:molecular chaperone GrpE
MQLNDQQTSSEPAPENQKADEYLAGWKRALADYDNLKKQVTVQISEVYQRAEEDVAADFAEVVDFADQAFQFFPPDTKNTNPYAKGLRLIHSALIERMKKHGLAPFGAFGDVFDPHKHESAGERLNSQAADQTVLDVLARGWETKEGVVVRSARVIVNKRN